MIQASQQSSSSAENQAGQDFCSVHKNAKKFHCKNCSIAVCEDCWNQSHIDHSVVPWKSVLKELTARTSDSWKLVELYQNNYTRLVKNSLGLNEEVVHSIEKVDELKGLNNKTQNAQNFQSFHSLQETSLKELNEQKKVVDHIISSISDLSTSSKIVQNSLNKAIDAFTQSKQMGSSQKTSSSALTEKATALGVKKWDLRDFCKNNATAVSFALYQAQFSSQTQEVFAESETTISVLKVKGDSIRKNRSLPFHGIEGNLSS